MYIEQLGNRLYLRKGVRQGKQTRAVTVEVLGTRESIEAREGVADAMSWAREYARKRTDEERQAKKAEKEARRAAKAKEEAMEALVRAKSKELHEKCPSGPGVGFGYIFFQRLFYELHLHDLFYDIKKKHPRLKMNLCDVMRAAVYSRLMTPSSYWMTWQRRGNLLEELDFDYQHLLRGIPVVYDDALRVQKYLYDHTRELVDRSTEVIYYDCTNYFFQIDDEDSPDHPTRNMRRRGPAKEHREKPIVGLGMAVDADGIPVCMVCYPGNESEQNTYPTVRETLRRMGIENIRICTDAGLASIDNRTETLLEGNTYLTVLSLRNMEAKLRERCLDPEGWTDEDTLAAQARGDEGAVPGGTSIRDMLTASMGARQEEDPSKRAERMKGKSYNSVYAKEIRIRRARAVIDSEWVEYETRDGVKVEKGVERIGTEKKEVKRGGGLRKEIRGMVSWDDVDAPPRQHDTVAFTKRCNKGENKGRTKRMRYTVYEYTERIFVTFSEKYRDYQRKEREGAIRRCEREIERGVVPTQARRYIKVVNKTESGDVATKQEAYLDEEVIAMDEQYDGFYATATCAEGYSMPLAIRDNKGRWMAEDMFRFSKTDVELRPIYVSRTDRISGHMLVFLIAATLYKLLLLRVNEGRGREDEGYVTGPALMDMLRTCKVAIPEEDDRYTRSFEGDPDLFLRICRTSGGMFIRARHTRDEIKDIIRDSKSRSTNRITAPPRFEF